MTGFLLDFCVASFLLLTFVYSEKETAGGWQRCGDTKWCIHYPAGCHDNGCTFAAVMGRSRSPGFINFKLLARNAHSNPYLAVRFSEIAQTGKSSIVLCAPRDDALRLAYDTGDGSDFAMVIAPEQFGKLLDSTIREGVVGCDFDRSIRGSPGELTSHSLEKPNVLQFSSGAIGDDGYPASAFTVFNAPQAFNFTAALPVLSVQDEKKSKKPADYDVIEEGERIDINLIKKSRVVNERDRPSEVQLRSEVDSKKSTTGDSKKGTIGDSKKDATVLNVDGNANATSANADPKEGDALVVDDHKIDKPTNATQKEANGTTSEEDDSEIDLGEFGAGFFMGLGLGSDHADWNDSFSMMRRAMLESNEDFDENMTLASNATESSKFNSTEPSGSTRVTSLSVLLLLPVILFSL